MYVCVCVCVCGLNSSPWLAQFSILDLSLLVDERLSQVNFSFHLIIELLLFSHTILLLTAIDDAFQCKVFKCVPAYGGKKRITFTSYTVMCCPHHHHHHHHHHCGGAPVESILLTLRVIYWKIYTVDDDDGNGDCLFGTLPLVATNLESRLPISILILWPPFDIDNGPFPFHSCYIQYNTMFSYLSLYMIDSFIIQMITMFTIVNEHISSSYSTLGL